MAEDNHKAQWIEVKIRTNGELAEALAEVLGRFVSNGVVVEAVTRQNPHTLEHEPTGQFDVSGYLTVDSGLAERRQKLEEALWYLGRITPIPEPVYSPVQDQNWMASWKKHYKPVPIGKTILVLPAWKEPAPDEQRLLVRINPAMAFGTGTHPSTQLSLLMMEAYLQPGKPVIDVGCGSGILSIVALKMGAPHALAVDIDGQALDSTRENAGLNKIESSQLEIGKGSVEEIQTGRFDLSQAPFVLVNILAPIIIRLFGQGLADLIRPGGMIFLAGILDHQAEDVLAAACAAGLHLVDQLEIEDWVGLVMKKPAPDQA